MRLERMRKAAAIFVIERDLPDKSGFSQVTYGDEYGRDFRAGSKIGKTVYRFEPSRWPR
jgi:hypothetical protein